jgi:hypothetical protein
LTWRNPSSHFLATALALQTVQFVPALAGLEIPFALHRCAPRIKSFRLDQLPRHSVARRGTFAAIAPAEPIVEILQEPT